MEWRRSCGLLRKIGRLRSAHSPFAFSLVLRQVSRVRARFVSAPKSASSPNNSEAFFILGWLESLWLWHWQTELTQLGGRIHYFFDLRVFDATDGFWCSGVCD